MGEGVVHDGHVDGADGAEILCHHEVRVEPGKRTLVEVVQVVPTVHRGGDEVVDLLAGQPFRHRTGRDDGAGASLLRVVALERHPDDLVTHPEVEEDLRGRRQKRHDPHWSILAPLATIAYGEGRVEYKSTTDRGSSTCGTSSSTARHRS